MATPEFKARMSSAGLNATPELCGNTWLTKMNQEGDRWARVVKATGFSALD
jgi:hypothetical protein